MIILYLVAVVLANLSVAYFGPSATVINAFLFIGFDLTSRDKLHDKWRGKNLWLKMFLLITSGGVISWLLNRDASVIAIASSVSFIAAGICDALSYHALGDRTKIIKINGSNIVSALVDSVVFPTLAFGSFMWAIVLGQFIAKTLGGFLWSLVLTRQD